MKRFLKSALAAATALLACSAALAEITIGASLSLTGPGSGLGIPMSNGLKMWPATVGGEKVRLIILDDATDPTKGVQNARRLVNEDKVDVIVGSGITPVAIAMAEVASESKTVQLALSPIGLPPGKDAWTFRMPQSNGVMAIAMVAHMQKQGVKSVGRRHGAGSNCLVGTGNARQVYRGAVRCRHPMARAAPCRGGSRGPRVGYNLRPARCSGDFRPHAGRRTTLPLQATGP